MVLTSNDINVGVICCKHGARIILGTVTAEETQHFSNLRCNSMRKP